MADSFSAVHNDPAAISAKRGAVDKLEIRVVEPAQWGRDVSAHNAENVNQVFTLPAGDWTRLDSFRLHGRFHLSQTGTSLATSKPFLQPKYMDIFDKAILKLGTVSETETECGITNWLNYMLISSDYANSTLSNTCFYTKQALGATPETVTTTMNFSDSASATERYQQFIAPPPMWQFWTSGDAFRTPMNSSLTLTMAKDIKLRALGFGVTNAAAVDFALVLDELYLTYEAMTPDPVVEAGISSSSERYLSYSSASYTDSGPYTATTMDFASSIGHAPAIIYYLWLLDAQDKTYADAAAQNAAAAALKNARVPLGLTDVKLQRLETYVNGQQIAPDLVFTTQGNWVDSTQAFTELIDGVSEMEIMQDRSAGTLWSFDRQRECLLIVKRCMARDPAFGGEFDSDAFNDTSCVVRTKVTHSAAMAASAHCYRFELAPHQLVFTGPADVVTRRH